MLGAILGALRATGGSPLLAPTISDGRVALGGKLADDEEEVGHVVGARQPFEVVVSDGSEVGVGRVLLGPHAELGGGDARLEDARPGGSTSAQ